MDRSGGGCDWPWRRSRICSSSTTPSRWRRSSNPLYVNRLSQPDPEAAVLIVAEADEAGPVERLTIDQHQFRTNADSLLRQVAEHLRLGVGDTRHAASFAWSEIGRSR